MKYRTMIPALPLALLALSAGAPAQSAPQSGEYRLQTVAGRALPAVVEEEDGCRDELVSATLTLAADGVWRLATTERETCGSEVSTDEEREEGRYTVSGATVRFLDEDGEALEAEDPDDASEIEIERLAVGTLGGGALTVRLGDGRTDLVFRQ